MQLVYKKCTIDYLEDLVKISRSTFIAAFEADNNPENFSDYIENAFNKIKLTEELSNPNSGFFFVYLNTELSGYFKLNEFDAQTDSKENDSIEIERIYVHPDYQGKKIGQEMLQEIKKLSIQKGKRFIWLGVWEKNTRAIQFYEREGFVKFGTHPYYIGTDKQTDWLMLLAL